MVFIETLYTMCKNQLKRCWNNSCSESFLWQIFLIDWPEVDKLNHSCKIEEKLNICQGLTRTNSFSNWKSIIIEKLTWVEAFSLVLTVTLEYLSKNTKVYFWIPRVARCWQILEPPLLLPRNMFGHNTILH